MNLSLLMSSRFTHADRHHLSIPTYLLPTVNNKASVQAPASRTGFEVTTTEVQLPVSVLTQYVVSLPCSSSRNQGSEIDGDILQYHLSCSDYSLEYPATGNVIAALIPLSLQFQAQVGRVRKVVCA